jgi:hypothetical protein
VSRSGPNDVPAARGQTGPARLPSDSTATRSFPVEYERAIHALGIAAVGSQRISVAARDALACAESNTPFEFGYCNPSTTQRSADNDGGLKICRLRNRRRKGPPRRARPPGDAGFALAPPLPKQLREWVFEKKIHKESGK